MTATLRSPNHPSPLLARLGSGRGLLRDVLAGAALLSATIALWGWFVLATLPSASAWFSRPATAPAASPVAQERASRAVRSSRAG